MNDPDTWIWEYLRAHENDQGYAADLIARALRAGYAKGIEDAARAAASHLRATGNTLAEIYNEGRADAARAVSALSQPKPEGRR